MTLHKFSQIRVLNNQIKRCYSSTVSQVKDVFEQDFEKNYCPTNVFQRIILTAGSAAVSIFNPYRGDMIACMGEVTGEKALIYMQNRMLNSHEGSQILKNRPRINTSSLDLKYLQSLPEDTLGKTYYTFLSKHHVSPDDRVMVKFIDDINLAYVMQRYREVHDLIHTVLQMPTNMLGEVTVKWVEALQFKLPMCVSGAVFGPVRLKPKHRQLYLRHYLPWAIQTGHSAEFLLNIYYEKRWEQKMDDFYKEFYINPIKIKK